MLTPLLAVEDAEAEAVVEAAAEATDEDVEDGVAVGVDELVLDEMVPLKYKLSLYEPPQYSVELPLQSIVQPPSVALAPPLSRVFPQSASSLSATGFAES